MEKLNETCIGKARTAHNVEAVLPIAKLLDSSSDGSSATTTRRGTRTPSASASASGGRWRRRGTTASSRRSTARSTRSSMTMATRKTSSYRTRPSGSAPCTRDLGPRRREGFPVPRRVPYPTHITLVYFKSPDRRAAQAQAQANSSMSETLAPAAALS